MFEIWGHQDEVVILVMGTSGSGKSSFIKTLSNDPSIVISRAFMPGTTEIQIISYVHQATGRKIKIVDTPSFGSEAGLTDTEILKRITRVLLDLYYKGQKLTGLIYVQSIQLMCFGGILPLNLRMFQSLCGQETFKNVIVLTTFWDTLQESEGKTWEGKLRTNYFKEMMEGGAHFMQHNHTLQSAEKVLRHVLTFTPTDVKVQKEIHVKGKTLEETAAGSMHRTELEKTIETFKKDITELGFEIEEANRVDPEFAEDLMREQKWSELELVKWESERHDLKRGLGTWPREAWSRRWKQREDGQLAAVTEGQLPSSSIASAAIPVIPSPETPRPSSATVSISSELLKLIPRLNAIFRNDNQKEQLLDCQGDDAQRLLDLFQSLLDMPDLKIKFRSRLLLATRELAKRAGILPRCYELHAIKVNYEDDYVDGGAFADILKCNFQGQAICLKAVRLFRNSEKAKFMRDISKEAVIWAQLNHPNILRMLGIFREKSRICLVSLWMEAGNLVQYLENRPTAPRRHLAMDVAQGLKYLHDNGIIHGDLKGMNVLINDQRVACLADFGLSSLPTVMHTQAMTSLLGTGTVFWTAPELFDYDETEDAPPVKPTTASDMYSWACVCYEIFIGKYPFWHIKRPAQTIPLHIKAGGRPQRPHDSHPSWTTYGLNIAIWSIMEDCWTESPDERPEIEYTIAQLKPMLGDDIRKLGSTHEALPPSYFRQHMNGDIDIAVVSSILDRI